MEQKGKLKKGLGYEKQQVTKGEKGTARNKHGYLGRSNYVARLFMFYLHVPYSEIFKRQTEKKYYAWFECVCNEKKTIQTHKMNRLTKTKTKKISVIN